MKDEAYEEVAKLLDRLHYLCEESLSEDEHSKAEKHIEALGAFFSLEGGFGSSAI